MDRVLASQVVTPDGIVAPGVVEVDARRIVAVRPTTGVVPDRVLVPGLVDLQVNGIDDVDVASADGADWDRLDQLLLAQGVTSWCPTLVTSPLDRYGPALGRIAAAESRPGLRPTIVGAHLEGPFLGDRHGAHRSELVIPPDLEWIETLPPIVRVMTVGPEVDRADVAIALLTGRGILVSIGHSGADLETGRAAVTAGARLMTHGYNAMSGLDHRAPGLVGAFLTDDRVAVSLIADLVHVHPAALDVAFRCKPAEQVVLVTDSVAWRRGRVGPVEMVHDGTAPRLPDGTLAGSSLSALDQAIANVVAHANVSLERAVAAASTNPARLLGCPDRGTIEVGRRADLAALDPISLRCTETWIAGHPTVGM